MQEHHGPLTLRVERPPAPRRSLLARVRAALRERAHPTTWPDTPPELRVRVRWRVYVRLDRRDFIRAGTDGMTGAPGWQLDPCPPAAGPEVEVSWLLMATDAVLAERLAQREWARRGIHPLAVRSVRA